MLCCLACNRHPHKQEAFTITVNAAGQAAAQQLFACVQDVITKLPQLSLLHSQLSSRLKDVSLFKQLQEPTFQGTVFAPVDAVGAAVHNCASAVGQQHTQQKISAAGSCL